MKKLLPLLALLVGQMAAHAFCGFYVAKADTKLFNKASQVVLVRDGDRTVLTMANDFEGDPKEFAVVIPVPTFLEKGQIHVADKALIEHLDAYTSPRLVEYFDGDPCLMPVPMSAAMMPGKAMGRGGVVEKDASLGIKVEAQYTIGEYDIVILSAEQSDGLETWLKENDYRIPNGASEVLGSYIKQKMHFFVAKVNLEEKVKSGFHYLRPLQVAYESPKFMLPIRLGTVNASGPQELFIYALTKGGRVETTNYRTVKLPTGMDIPLYVKEEFGDFYKAIFDHQVKKEGMKAVFTEYAWDMGWCDPCAADPLSAKELRQLGVFWVEAPAETPRRGRGLPFPGGTTGTFVTRLHVRYDRDHFPEDLVFQETGDRENFQGRYVLRHPWRGEAKCDAAKKYVADLPNRAAKEAQTLSMLTGWDREKISEKMAAEYPPTAAPDKKWWQSLWK